MSEFGSSYLTWKGWGAQKPFGALAQYQRALFSAEIKRTGLKNIKKVLDVGFGNGAFLSFAREKSWEVSGVEVNVTLVAEARQSGFNAFTPQELEALPPQDFDLIVLFDVLEHLEIEEAGNFLSRLKRHLRAGGVLLVRVPNGDSVCGIAFQNGDPTHKTFFGSGKLRYVAELCGLQTLGLKAEALPVFSQCWRLSCYALFAKPLRAIFGGLARFLFAPGKKFVYASPNLVGIFRRGPQKDAQP